MTEDHISQIYNDELAKLEQLLTEMVGKCEWQMMTAIKTLTSHDPGLAREVVEADVALDMLQAEIDELAIYVIAKRQPMAGDLRMTVGSMKIANDLERIGDYAKNIAKRVSTIADTATARNLERSLERMSVQVVDMINDTLFALLNRSVERANAVIKSDEDVDSLYTSLFREIITYMAEDPRVITACTHYLFIARNIERIGDHVTNIAEQIIYIIEGTSELDRRNLDKTATATAPETE